MRRVQVVMALSVVLTTPVALPQAIVPQGTRQMHGRSSSEDLEWDRIKKSNNLLRFYSFQSRYPEGRHKGAVARRIAELEEQARKNGEPVNSVAAGGTESALVVDSSDASRGYIVRVVPAEGSRSRQSESADEKSSR